VTVIYGAYGGYNAGDEVILDTLVAELKALDPKDTITVICNPRKNYSPIDVSRVVSKSNIFRVVHSLRGENLVIGGGQLLNGTILNKGLLYILFLMVVSKILGAQQIIVGVGSEKIVSRTHKALCGLIIRLSDFFLCRDSYTYGMTNRLGEGVSQAADLVFLQNAEKKEKSHLYYESGLVVGVAVHSDPRWRFASTASLIDIIKNCTDLDVVRQVVVIAHDNRPEYDKGLIEEIESKISNDKLTFRVLYSPKQTYEVYENLDYIVSARMHPLIIGAIKGVRPIAISESGKVRSLFEGTGMLVDFTNEIARDVKGIIVGWNTCLQEEFEAWLDSKQEEALGNRKVIQRLR